MSKQSDRSGAAKGGSLSNKKSGRGSHLIDSEKTRSIRSPAEYSLEELAALQQEIDEAKRQHVSSAKSEAVPWDIASRARESSFGSPAVAGAFPITADMLKTLTRQPISSSTKLRSGEVSSSRPIAPRRQTIAGPKQQVSVDPRFLPPTNRAEEATPAMLADRYAFLHDMRRHEVATIKKTLNSRKLRKPLPTDVRTRLHSQMQKINSEDNLRKKLSAKLRIKSELEKKEAEAVVKTGKRAYFVSDTRLNKLAEEAVRSDRRRRHQKTFRNGGRYGKRDASRA